MPDSLEDRIDRIAKLKAEGVRAATVNRGAESPEDRLKRIAQGYADLALNTLVDVMGDTDAPAVARVAASRTMMERGFGMPDRKTETNVNVNVFDARTAHFKALQELAEMKAALPPPMKTIEAKANPVKSEFEE